MSSLLDFIPGVSTIIDKVVPNPNKKKELELEFAKLDSKEAVERIKALQAMFKNDNLFVSGAIPAIIWVFALSLLNNYVLMPWAKVFGANIPAIVIPDSVVALIGGIITVLLGKKYKDENEFYYPNGQLKSPSKLLVKAKAANAASVYYAPEEPQELQTMQEEPDPVPMTIPTPAPASTQHEKTGESASERLNKIAKERGLI